MADLHTWLGYYGDLMKLVGIVTAILLAGISFTWYYSPPIRMVWRCLVLEERGRFWKTLAACKASAWPFKPSTFRKQMRLWLELRILQPRPEREPHWHFDNKHKRFDLEYDNLEYPRAYRKWLQSNRNQFALLKLRDSEPVIELANVFELNNEATKKAIKHYLMAVSELNLSKGEDSAFLCKVCIHDGFLLPLNLLAGLMSHFSDDWDPIISSYSQLAGKSFSNLQMSIFDLWLLWGPSIPLCRCDQWVGPIALQYGFGDENNSVRLRISGTQKLALLKEFKETLLRNNQAYPAIHASVTGRLWPPSSFMQSEFCAAQCDHSDPNNEAFILEYDHHNAIGHPAGSHIYYTAYVWAMFVIGRETKPGLDELRNQPWLHIIPFFEHANIVDEICYTAAKQQLAHKVLNFLRDSPQYEYDTTQAPPRLWFVSALDDSGCGTTLEVPPNGRSIRETLRSLLKQPSQADLQDRIELDDDSFAAILSGCHLPDMLHAFFNSIERVE